MMEGRTVPMSLLDRPVTAARLARALVIVHAFLLLAVVVWRGGTFRGYEAETVARVLIAGHGYAFPADRAWLATGGMDDYLPTAWTDPLRTLLHAVALLVAGERFGYLLAFLGILFGAAASWVTLRLAERHLHPWAGLVVAATMSLSVAHMSSLTVATPLAMLGIALLLRALLEARTGWRAVTGTGLLLGLTALTWSAAQLFLPLIPLLWWWRTGCRHAGRALAMLAVALAVIAPWTVRNALVFGEFVPLRTGSGQILHLGTVALGGTVDPTTIEGLPPLPWRAATPAEAVARVLGGDRPSGARAALERWQHELLRLRFGDDAGADEAVRDAWLRREAVAYALDHPRLVAALGLAKLRAFLTHTPGSRRLAGFTPGAFAALLALTALLPWRRYWRERLLAGLPFLAYAALFLLITPYFYRYRMPVEPLVAFLAAATVVALVLRGDRPAAAAAFEGDGSWKRRSP